MPSLLKTSSIKGKVWIAFKVLLLIALFLFIYYKLKDQDGLALTFTFIKDNVGKNWHMLLLIISLMPLNWLIEARKWQLLAQPLGRLTLINALQGVLTGLSLSFITPHGLGDYLGRILQNPAKERGRYLGAIMISRMSQMMPTLVLGSWGVFYILPFNYFLLYLIILLSTFISFALILSRKHKMSAMSFLPRRLYLLLVYYFGIIGEYPLVLWLRIILLSSGRYVVFVSQFVVAIYMFNPRIAIDLNIAGTTWILLAKSVLPSFNFLSDLGVREFSAIYFFEHHGVELIPVVSASLTIWLVNILLPTLAGAPLTLKMKLQ